MHIKPATSSLSSSRHSATSAGASLGSTPAFCGSAPVLTWMKRESRLPWRCISSATARAIFSRSIEWMASNSSTASFVLLDCSGPMRCNSTSGNSAFSAGHLALASCTRFSPNRRWPACRTGTIAGASNVLETAISLHVRRLALCPARGNREPRFDLPEPACGVIRHLQRLAHAQCRLDPFVALRLITPR